MPLHPLAGQPAPPSMLADIPRLITAYYTEKPDPGEAAQRVSFGTSGHRGSSFDRSFNEAHILAITQAICRHRAENGITGPLFLAKDTHALSEPAFATALEVLAANGVDVCVDAALGYTPTPALSLAILTHNRGRQTGLADGIVITPSHNPPEDGGFKYNPPNGGPADTAVTGWIEKRANESLAAGLTDVRRCPYAKALAAAHALRFRHALRRRAGRGRGSRCHSRRRPLAGRRPAGRRRHRLLAAHRRTLRPLPRPPARYRRPHLPLHVRGLGRQNPHGLLLALRHGRPDRAQRPLRPGLRLRYRSRPPRHRHAQRRPAQSESLPGRRHFVSLFQPPAVARRCRRGQDDGFEQHHRPRRRQPRPPPVGSAGRLQVVRRRIAGWLARLRRRGERRGVVPAPRRRRLDHR